MAAMQQNRQLAETERRNRAMEGIATDRNEIYSRGQDIQEAGMLSSAQKAAEAARQKRIDQAMKLFDKGQFEPAERSLYKEGILDKELGERLEGMRVAPSEDGQGLDLVGRDDPRFESAFDSTTEAKSFLEAGQRDSTWLKKASFEEMLEFLDGPEGQVYSPEEKMDIMRTRTLPERPEPQEEYQTLPKGSRLIKFSNDGSPPQEVIGAVGGELYELSIGEKLVDQNGKTIAEGNPKAGPTGIRLTTNPDGTVSVQTGVAAGLSAGKAHDESLEYQKIKSSVDMAGNLRRIVSDENIGLTGRGRILAAGASAQARAALNQFIGKEALAELQASIDSIDPPKEMAWMWDQNLSEVQMMSKVLVFRLAKIMDPAARLSDRDVKAAEQALGVDNWFASGMDVRARLKQFQRMAIQGLNEKRRALRLPDIKAYDRDVVAEIAKEEGLKPEELLRIYEANGILVY
jgi:hypothetical protein